MPADSIEAIWKRRELYRYSGTGQPLLAGQNQPSHGWGNLRSLDLAPVFAAGKEISFRSVFLSPRLVAAA
jgi:hypothetical protein